nr:MAG TPA: hypothetical protein [Caudoviricetes sp.]
MCTCLPLILSFSLVVSEIFYIFALMNKTLFKFLFEICSYMGNQKLLNYFNEANNKKEKMLMR